MLPRRVLLLFNTTPKYNDSIRHVKQGIISRRHFAASAYDVEDPAPLFVNIEVQALLKDLTRADLSKVFRRRTLGSSSLEPPEYKFMTTEELEKAIEASKQKAQGFLQMPPVVKVKKDDDRVISHDPALQGYDTSNFVFTDITYGVKDSDRIIVVRDTEGYLKPAKIELRKRINQVYFPTIGRKVRTPRLFEEKNFKDILEKQQYEFILDRICLQFDPNDEDFHKYTQMVYEHLNENKQFQSLRSTRHFGPMAFYLCWTKYIDNLLQELIQTNFILDAVKLVALFYKFKPECKSNLNNRDFVKNLTAAKEADLDSKTYNECINFVEDYINQDSTKRSQLQLGLQAHRELYKQQRELSDGIKAAHGLA